MAEDTMLHEAIGAVQNGDRTRARDLLTRLIKTNPNKADYWLWMSSVVDTTKERVYCLQEALRRDPANPAVRRGLAMLGIVPPDEMAGQTGMVRRNWQPKFAEPEPDSKLLTRQSAPKLVVGLGAGVIVVALIAIVFVKVRGPVGTARPAALTTQKPTATYMITGTPVVRSPTPTFIGPTPLWMMLAATYTPTPFYVNTPHPRTEAYRSGIRALQQGDWKGMITFMQQVAAAEPDAADAYYFMGEGYRQLGDCGEALDQYNQAIDTNVNFAPSYLGRARCHFAQNPKLDVQPDLDRALELDPNMADARLEMARIAILNGEAQVALDQLDKAVELLPDSPIVYLLKAQAELANNQPVEAIGDAEKANQLDSTLLDAYRVLGEAHQANQDVYLSVTPLEIYARYVSDDPQVWVMLGRGYHAHREDDLAMEAFSKALKLDKRLLEAYVARGQIYLDQGDAKSALDDLTTAVLLDTKSFPANLGKGRAYLALGFAGDAYLAIDRAASYAVTDADRASLYYWRAKSLDALGRKDASQHDWLALQAIPGSAVPAGWRDEALTNITSTATPGPTATVTPTASSTPRPTATKKK